MKNWLSVTKDNNKKHIIIYGAISAVFSIVALLLSVFWVTALASGAVLFAVLYFRIEIKEYISPWVRNVLMVIFSLMIFILMQTTISCGIFLVGILKFIMNVLIILGATSLIWGITGKMRLSVIIVTLLTQILAVADHLVVQARSFEIQFSDFFSLGTAAAVADQYEFELSVATEIGIILSIFFVVFLLRLKLPKSGHNVKQLIFCLSSVVVAVLCVVIVYTQFAASVIGYQDKYWKYRGSERNGYFVNMIYSASATRVLIPEGYDADVLVDDTREYIGDAEVTTDSEGKKQPNVIVIMNETFADVQNIAESMGGEMKTDIEVTPFLDSLDDAAPNIIKGYALSSVYGGNTANSELEFLTGLSVQFIPRNTVAYNLYIKESNSFTIVDAFNEVGYKTVSIHPENPTNWQRDMIYDYFNFDEQYFKGDFSHVPEEDYFRGHIRDKSVYEKIIDIYENKEEGTPLFNFTITMHNHSGFATPGFEYTVDIEGMSKYTGIREYLTAINASDSDFKELIEYFEKEEEETIIVFFGDHQPSLSNIASKFYGVSDDDTTLRQLSKYVVPYVFWANYDIDCERATELSSINFLSSYLRELVEVPETDLNRFVDKLNEEVMAMNAMGWFDHEGNFHESSYSAPSLSPSLELYSYLQYNMLYDDINKKTELFALPKVKD
ncbi:MAG: sulfatase-like hydrolase/transferase [Clostridia bacterium]|nr:sulfatase-like hydrolase/transferase [Clostridia bacterium]